jgi:TPR repeat protein
MKKIFLATVLSVLALPTVAFAQNAQITECDKLVSHSEDPERVSPGIDDVKDKTVAITACEADVKKDPNNRRLRYQLGRVLFYDQQTAKALPHLEFAANAGSQQAQFVLGYITDEALQGIKRDACKVEDLWFKSANQCRFAALVSYPHHVMNARFEGCKQQANVAQIDAYLAKAKKDAAGYYQQLLVKTLTSDFERFKQKK